MASFDRFVFNVFPLSSRLGPLLAPRIASSCSANALARPIGDSSICCSCDDAGLRAPARDGLSTRCTGTANEFPPDFGFNFDPAVELDGVDVVILADFVAFEVGATPSPAGAAGATFFVKILPELEPKLFSGTGRVCLGS